MSRISRFALAASVLSFVGLASAIAGEYSNQVDRLPFRDSYTLVYELKCPLVIAALEITPDQSARIAAATAALMSEGAAEVRKRKALTPEQDQERIRVGLAELKALAAKDDVRFEALTDEEKFFYDLDLSMSQASRDFERRAEKILRPEQMRRLKEIVVRMNGPEIFSKRDRAPFELTIEQKLKFDVLLEKYRAACRKLREEYADHVNDFIPGEERGAYTREHHRKLRAEGRKAVQSLVAELTPRQKEIFDRLRGEDFDLDRLDEEKDQEFHDRAAAEAEAKFRERAGTK